MRDFQSPGRSPVISINGICATSHPLASRVAIRILEDGGNAVDAAIAAAVLLGLCEPQMSGIGGDCFALVKPAGQDGIISLNGSGRAPKALDADKLRAAGLKAIDPHSPEAVTIPGAIEGFCRLSRDWGRLGLSTSLAPAIYYARSGIPVSQRTAKDWATHQAILQGAGRNHYLLNGQAPVEGQVFHQPKQADVLERIALDGPSAFYEGEIAQDMVSSLQAAGGIHTLDDFAAMESYYSDPISGSYRGVDLIEQPPNSQGVTAILMANILSHFDLADLDPFGVERTHLEAEAAKLAHDAQRRFVADADYVEHLDHMLNFGTAEALANLIDPRQAMESPANLADPLHPETVCLSVMDKDLMAVSLIYSISGDFGSGICSDEFGVLFQNRGAYFSLEPGHPNEAAGGKRSLHTIIPAMLRRGGKVIMPYCVMGGRYQPTGHVRVMSNMLDFGMDPQAAIDGPRAFANGGVLGLERGYDASVRQALQDMGHNVITPPMPYGGAQATLIDYENGTFVGASDARKDGLALGF